MLPDVGIISLCQKKVSKVYKDPNSQITDIKSGIRTENLGLGHNDIFFILLRGAITKAVFN